MWCKPTRIRISFLILSILYTGVFFGQDSEFIRGKLINVVSKEPIPFATIQVKNKAKGVISNFDGSFLIPLRFRTIGDTLKVSSLGFRSKEVVLSSLDVNRVNVISLIEEVEALDEVVVAPRYKKPLKAKEIIRRALQRIPQNFSFSPYSYVGYYRDYQLKKGTYVNLNESVMEVFDRGFGFQDLSTSKIRIYQYKQNTNFERDSNAAKPYDYNTRSKIITNATIDGQGGNEYTILRLHDAIRNYNIETYSYVHRLDRDFLENHEFRLVSDTYLNGVSLYTIQINKAENNINVVGTIYIEKDNFQIQKMEYAVYQGKRSFGYREANRAKLIAPEIDEKGAGKLLYEINVAYQNHKNKMYLNYISFNNVFEYLEPPQFRIESVKADLDLKCYRIYFNKTPVEEDIFNKKKYKLWYKGKKLEIVKISQQENSVLLFPKDVDLLYKVVQVGTGFRKSSATVSLEVKNIKDVDGNVLNASKSSTVNQFREFFVQQLKLKSDAPKDNLFMIKTRPIFQGQPIVPPDNLSDFWMNTPLKNK